MAHQSFAQTVLETLKKESRTTSGEVSVTRLSCALHLQTRKDHKRMLNTLSDLVRSGRAVRLRQGVYGVGGKETDRREVMWRTLRMRRCVTIADLQEFAGVSPSYAKEWLAMLHRRQVVIRVDPAPPTQPRSWRLANFELTEMPVDTEKAAKLRDLRKAKKQQLLKTIDSIGSELRKVRKSIASMEEE